jgi:hypothetical protein
MGDGRVAVVLGPGVRPILVHAEIAGALDTLNAFAWLDTHERNLRARIRDPERARTACALLHELAATGMLERADAIVASARAAAGPPPSRRPIRILATVTRDRPKALLRSLSAFLANAAKYGRQVEVVVADDARDAGGSATCRDIVARCGRAHGASAVYIGRREKALYADRLAREAQVDPALVRFALLGLEGVDCSIGANRNAALLACRGRPFLAFDDDVEPMATRGLSPRPGVVFGPDRSEYRFFADRGAVLASVEARDEDVIAEHERWLGRSLGQVIAAEDPTHVDLSGATAEMLRNLRLGNGHVRATLTGVFGDSAMYSGVGLLLGGADPPRAGMFDEEATFRTAMTSRELVRVVSTPAIGHPVPFMTTSFAFDPAAGSPPFVPVLRNEDGAFGAILAACFDGAYAAQLPLALLHAAAPGRTYERDRVSAAAITRLADVFVACALSAPFDEGAGDSRDRLRGLGAKLESIGAAPVREYEHTVRSLLLRQASRRATKVQLVLDRNPRGAPHWIADLRQHLAALHEAVLTEEYFKPSDLADGRSQAEQLTLARTIVRDYGRLLRAWPDLWEAAAALGARGKDGLPAPMEGGS